MKKFLLLIVCLLSFSAMSFADNDKPISFNQLPQKAKVFIKKHFQVTDIQRAFLDDDEYEVQLKGGMKIEFENTGRWKEIESKKRPVPKALVPARLMKEARAKFGPKVKVMELSRDNEEIEVKLSNGKEIKMDRKSKKVEVDD